MDCAGHIEPMPSPYPDSAVAEGREVEEVWVKATYASPAGDRNIIVDMDQRDQNQVSAALSTIGFTFNYLSYTD